MTDINVCVGRCRIISKGVYRERQVVIDWDRFIRLVVFPVFL